LLVVTEHGLLTKDPKVDFTNNTFIADLGEDCHMRGSLEGTFNTKPYLTDILVGKIKTMPTDLKGD
jgi:hypothetical protein